MERLKILMQIFRCSLLHERGSSKLEASRAKKMTVPDRLLDIAKLIVKSLRSDGFDRHGL